MTNRSSIDITEAYIESSREFRNSLALALPPIGTNSTSWLSSSRPEHPLQVEIDQSAFQFDSQVAHEVILHIASKVKDSSFHRIAKLLYFADQLHLNRYGRLICGERYIAMKYGPVPSRVYDMLKLVRDGLSYPGGRELLKYEFVVQNNHTVVPLREPNLDWLSPSELECLDETIIHYGQLSFSELTELSHDDAWRSTPRNQEITIETIIRSMGDPDGLLEHIQNPHP